MKPPQGAGSHTPLIGTMSVLDFSYWNRKRAQYRNVLASLRPCSHVLNRITHHACDTLYELLSYLELALSELGASHVPASLAFQLISYHRIWLANLMLSVNRAYLWLCGHAPILSC